MIENELENVLRSYKCLFESYDLNIEEMKENSGKISSKFHTNLHVKTEIDRDGVFLIYNAAYEACSLQGKKEVNFLIILYFYR